MRYLGGKVRIAKPICDYLNKLIKDNNIQRYHEPFCRACNIITNIDCLNKFASDSNKYLIAIFREMVSNGWVPPITVTKEEYQLAKLLTAYPDYLTGFIGFGCSYSGKWFGGYAQDNTGRNYALNARNSLLRKTEKLTDVFFVCEDYITITESAEDTLIYCDPPYQGTTGYKGTGVFDHVTFWQWARDMSKDNIVIISEYTAPDDFECVLEIETKTDMQTKSGKEKRVEKLFKYRGNNQ